MTDPKSLAIALALSFSCIQAPAFADADEPAFVVVSPGLTAQYPRPGSDPKASADQAKIADDDAKAKSEQQASQTEIPAELALPVPKLSKAEMEQSVQCLALNIYHEARSEPLEGREAVAAVTINRTAAPGFPDSVCAVVQQGGKSRSKGCQFSWWCDRYSDQPKEQSAWSQALSLSRQALQGKVADPTDGALYYHARYVKPRWARTFKRTEKIGRHLFYKPRGA